jgi:hypothetical protein
MSLPSLAVLDSFKRGNEDPLSNGGKWQKQEGHTSLSISTAGKIVSEKYVGETANENSAFWSPEEFTEKAVAVYLYGVETGLEGPLWLYNCLQSPEIEGNKSGYILLLQGMGAGALKWTLYADDFTGKVEGSAVTNSTKDGDGAALWVNAGLVSAWYKPGAGAWEELFATSSASYTKGYAAIRSTKSENGALTNFSVSGTGKYIQSLSGTLPFSGKLVPHKESSGNTNTLSMIIS